MDKMNSLIEKYENNELIEETVAGKKVTITRFFDVTSLKNERKNWITLEQCQNIVNAALALLKIMPNTFHLTRFVDVNDSELEITPNNYHFLRTVTECDSEFCFRHLYFASPLFCKMYATTHLFCKEQSSDFIREIKMVGLPEPELYDYDKIVITYTDFDKFIEYIKKSDEAIEFDFIKSFWQD